MFKIRRKFIVFTSIILLLIISSFVFAKRAFSYDTNIAHPNIVALAAQVYNQNYDSDLTQEQISWMLQGAMAEDTPTRWFNHFYDPVYQVGFKGEFSTAKAWSRMPGYQSTFALGDKTWYRAIDDFQKGDGKSAFIALGHILHLIADMSVPAHTRDDAHPTGDSYEQFLKNNWQQVIKQINNFEKKQFSNLDNVFDDLANYSNQNFYSDDTINAKRYPSPNLDKQRVEYIDIGGGVYYKFAVRTTGDEQIKLCRDKVTHDWRDTLLNKNSILNSCVINNPQILTDYSTHLLPRAISYSASTINLFFKETEKKQNVELPKNKVSLLGATDYLVGTTISKAGELWDKLKGKDESLVMAALPQTLSPAAPKADVSSVIAEINASPPLPETEPESKKNAEAQPQTLPSKEIVVAPESIIIFENKEPKNTEIKKSVEIKPLATSTAPIVYNYSYGGGGGGGGNSNNDQTSIPSSQTESDNQTASTTPETTATTTPTIVLPEISVNAATTPVNTATTTISGTKNEATISVILNITGTITYPSSTAWQVDLSLPDGENIIEIYGENSTGQHSATSTIAVTVDTTAPAVPSINVVQSEFATPTLYISWQSLDSGTGIDNYDVEYVNDTNEWMRIFTNTTSTDYKMEAERLKTYQFRARAYDHVGNVSEWSAGQQIIPDWPRSVVISEVAWMGTGPTPAQKTDEWLELYNTTGADINLTGWKIFIGSTLLNFTNLINPVIPASGYLLLERTDDNAVYDISADIIFTGDIPNSCTGLTLTDASGNTIDQIGCNGANWYAGTTSDYRTMERLSSTAPGGLASNWQASDSVAPKGRPSGGSVIYGSPKLPNTGYWLLKGNLASYYSNLITNNILTLSKAHSPYFLDYQTIIPAGLTVKIEPGAVLVGYDRSSFFDVSGELQFNGTAEEPIIITSALDNNYFNRPDFSTLSNSQPAGGDWSRIEIKQGGKFSASHVKFFYGGKKFFIPGGFVFGGKYVSQIIRNYGGLVNMDEVVFQNNFLDTDVSTQPFNAVVYTEAPFGYNATTTVNQSRFDGGWLAIKNYRQNNGRVIYSSLTNNIFSNFSNPTGPIVSQSDFPTFSNNIFISNSSDMMDLGIWTLNADATLNPGVNYLFNSIIVPAGITLTVFPGVNLTMSSGDIQVNGSLKALGTTEAPININPPAGGQWGIMLFSSSDSVLQNVNFNGGNISSLRPATSRGVITAENSNLIMENVNVIDSSRPESMMYFNNSTVDIKNSSLIWTAPWHSGSWLIRGITMKGGLLNLDDVNFNRMDYGIYIISGQIGTMENMGPDNFQNISISNQWPLAF